MSVIRRVNRPDSEFTMIRNAFLRDASLSFHARGLGGWLLSHVEGWECNTVSIAKQAGIGRDQVRRALRELEAARYLRRTRVRTASGTLGDAVYEIQCEPFPEKEKPSSNQRLENQALVDQALVSPHHKKNTSKKTNQEDQPSGGEAASPALAPESTSPHEEEPMSKVDKAQASLFDVPAPPKAPRTPSAADAVAAYVTSYRLAHAGREPLKADKGRVGRDAALLLARGEATVAELVEAATEMGKTEYANLGQQVKFVRTPHRGGGGSRPPGMAPASPHTNPVWSELASKAELAEFDAETEERFRAAMAVV